ncbi:MarR family winged helix-turn-helix transcriptional regulator [Acidisphaera rubrifaciens]|uniref:Transcriptional regulator MarR n=1 Tax=Acidisphaera rubrifaciens HS-AP3 TaxID=1231350 RepID=A0A0D6PA32_9PROT|nr:MarR family transcriptional regulator [Acidisphaera rubrifaciens]GAN78068.1 transcriptional regulator MarR [Acidisphaera rubrifaciens HS-AP3]
MTGRDLARRDYEALAAFRHALRRFAAFSETEARAIGLTSQQHQALLSIKGMPRESAHQEGVSVADLAAHLIIRPNTAVELVDRLVGAGLVTRQDDPADGRRTLVALTPRADALLRDLSMIHREELRAIRPTLLRLLDAF